MKLTFKSIIQKIFGINTKKTNAHDEKNSTLANYISSVIPENPLVPYYKAMHPSWERTFNNEKRPMSVQEHSDMLHSMIGVKSFLNEEKSPILEKIWQDAQYIQHILEPLDKLKIKYTLDLTGGAVRDFLLNKHAEIKDLDFMLSMPDSRGYQSRLYLDQPNPVFTKEELDSVDWENATDSESKKIKLIELCFKKAYQPLQSFVRNNNRVHDLINNPGVSSYGMATVTDRLIGVFKTESKTTNYPIDLLLTDFTKPAFIKDFDFDICKASMCFVNPNKDKKFPKHFSHLISRTVADFEFFADVKNKKNTYDSNNRSLYQVNKSMGDHLTRIINKYPEYTTNIVGEGPFLKEAHAILLKHNLNKNLKDHSDKPATKIMKI